MAANQGLTTVDAFAAHIAAHPDLKARFGVEGRFRPPGDQHNDRMLDVFWRYTDAPLVKQGSVTGMPDRAVEIESPDDTTISMCERPEYDLNSGCRMVWLILPAKRIVEVCQPDVDIEMVQPGGTIRGGDLLPGFTLNVADLFQD